MKDQGYLGAVAVAGTVNPRWFMLFEQMNTPESFYAVYAAYAVKARFSALDVKEMLSPSAFAHHGDLTSVGCWYYGAAVARSGELGRVLEPGWEDNALVQRFMAENETFRRPIAGPVFLLAGGADQSVPPESIREAAEEACRRAVTVQFRLYPGLDHDPLMDRSTPDQLDWIERRFAGEPAPTNCGALGR